MNRKRISQRNPQASRASALVTTLMVVAVLSIIVVAFLQSMSIERRVAQSYANKEKARLAAEAGLQEFIATFNLVTATNAGYVVYQLPRTDSNAPVPILGVISNNGTQTAYPLLSTTQGFPLTIAGNQLTNLTTALNTALGDGTRDVNRPISGGGLLIAENGDLPNQTIFRAAPIPLSTNSGLVTQYLYRVVDDSGKLNLSHMGRSYSGTVRTNAVETQSNFLAEVAVSGAFSNAFTSDELQRFKNLSTNNAALEHLGQLFNNRTNLNAAKHLYTFNNGEFIERIPQGFFSNSVWTPYPDAGKLKYNLNDYATNTAFGASSTDRAITLANIISTNLTNFTRRDRSFQLDGQPAESIRYIRRLTASMVDYIDSDTTPTALPDGEPAGKDLFPLPTKIVEKWRWISTSGAGTVWTVTLRHTLFVELWNPYTVNVSGTFGMEVTTMRPVLMTGTAQSPFSPISGDVAINNLRPNEMRVYQLAEQDKVITVNGSDPRSNTANYPKMGETKSDDDDPNVWHSRFTATWNGQLIDRTPNEFSPFFVLKGPGLKRNAMTGNSTHLVPAGTPRFGTSLQQARTANGAFRTIGDPRQNHINNYAWEAPVYNNADLRWNGRGSWATNSAFTQDYAGVWSARDAYRASPNVGATVSATQDPTAATSLYNLNAHGVNAPAYIRNGPMLSIAELGHIYDPAHVNDRGFVTDAANPDSYYTSGGGRTLRIGQPEFNYSIGGPGSDKEFPALVPWDSPGSSASHLLDLFTAHAQGTNAYIQQGKVNVNTAPREVLAALFFNLAPRSDAGARTGNPAISGAGATNIANTIISNRPYYNSSDMTRFLAPLVVPTNFSPQFGTNSTNMMVFDRAREEVFRRAYDSLDVTSGAFRVFSVGQVVDSNGRQRAEAKLESLVEIRYSMQGTNVIATPIVVYRKYH